MSVDEQLVNICFNDWLGTAARGSGGDGGDGAAAQIDAGGAAGSFRNIHELCGWIQKLTPAQSPTLFIILAKAGTGKTWLTRQAMRRLSASCSTPDRAPPLLPLLPLLISVHKLAHAAQPRKQAGAAPTETDYVEDFIAAEYTGPGLAARADVLLRAYAANQLFVIFDGLDEAPSLRDDLVAFITDPARNRARHCLLTSRPEGMGHALTRHVTRIKEAVAGADDGGPASSVHVYDLAPYTWEQQQRVLRQHLSDAGSEAANTFMDKLFEYIQARAGLDAAFAFVPPVDARRLSGKANASFDTTREKLLVQVIKDGPDAAPRPVQTAEELCEVAEAARPGVVRAMHAIAERAGLPVVPSAKALDNTEGNAGLLVGPPKKKDRILVKAKSYEAMDGPAVSWVLDAVRFSFVCATAGQAADVLASLTRPDGSSRVVRLKNFFRDLDETHYRRLQCVVMMAVDGEPDLHHLVEVQIHLAGIYKFRA